MPDSTVLRILQGSEWGYRWPVDPAPLAGSSVKAHVRARVDSADILHTWSTDAGNATVGPEGVTILVPSEVSSTFTWRKGVFDVEYTDAAGDVHRIAQGWVGIDPEVTR